MGRTAVLGSLASNALALGFVYVFTTLFINSILAKDEKKWFAYVIAFCLSVLIAVCVYTFVYFTFGYLPMGHVGPDVLQRLTQLEEVVGTRASPPRESALDQLVVTPI